MSLDLDLIKAALADPIFHVGEWTEVSVRYSMDARVSRLYAIVLNAAPDLVAEVERLRQDNEATDGTDAAHPSYWRGSDATFAAMSEQLRKILDGEDDCSGKCQEPWNSLRRRVLALRQELATATAVGAAEELRDLLTAYYATHQGGSNPDADDCQCAKCRWYREAEIRKGIK